MKLTLEELNRLENKVRKIKKANRKKLRGHSWRAETAFNGKDQVIVKTFMPEEFDKIPPARIWSFLDAIVSPKEEAILHTWMKHLESVKVPYRVTEQIIDNYRERNAARVKILWTERKA